MDCDSIRAAMSAGLDGEDPGVRDEVTDAHLARCADCRAWQQRAHVITRRVRLGGHVLSRDLTPQVLAALPGPRSRRPVLPRAGLLAVALTQLGMTVPVLVLGHDPGAGLHAAHELGSFNLALAIAFAVGAVRPGLSAGLAWPCGIAALGLAGTAVADMAAGQTFGAGELQHLAAMAGALLLLRQARLARGTPAGRVPMAAPAGPGSAPGGAGPWLAPRGVRAG